MAENLKPIMKKIAFTRLLLSYAHKTNLKLSDRIQYLTDIQNKLGNIYKTTVTAEEVGQYTMVIGEIVHSTHGPIKNINNPINQLVQQVYDEIAEEEKQCDLFSNLDKDPSEQNKEIINRLEKFIISQHQAEAEKVTKTNEFPTYKLPQLTCDTITDAQAEALMAQFTDNQPIRKTPYIIAGAILAIIAYYCNLHEKLADFIGYK